MVTTGKSSPRRLRRSAVVAALLSLWPALSAAQPARCANPQDIEAFRTLALRLRLMALATHCQGQDTAYNAHIAQFRDQHVASDRAVSAFFGAGGPQGQRDKAAYTVELANAASRSLMEGAVTCAAAGGIFAQLAALPLAATLADSAPGPETHEGALLPKACPR